MMLPRRLSLARLFRLVRPSTAFRRISVLCPVCEKVFRSQKVVSMSVCATRTDLYQLAAGTPPLAHLIHTCPTCGYSGAEDDFGEDVDLSPTLKTRVRMEIAAMMPHGAASGSEKYEAAAKIVEWEDGDPRRVADLLLRAAWCCVEEGDIEAERYFRRKAAWKFEEALRSFDGVAPEERAALTYLVAELWRRVGQAESAAEWFDRVAPEVVDARTQQWVIDAARQQRDRPREWLR